MAGLVTKNVASEMRFGHSDGHTDVCYHPNGKLLLTGGTDAEVRVWNLEDDDADAESYYVENAIYSIAVSETHFFVCSSGNQINSYNLEDGKFDSTILHFTANGTHLDISKDGKLLVAGASDFVVKLIDLETKSLKVFEGHRAPILGVSLDPQHKYVASSSCDGSVQIWSIEDQRSIQVWSNNHPKSNDLVNSPALFRIDWSPSSGNHLAVPGDDEVKIYNRDTWECSRSYNCENFKNISLVKYSPSGKFIVAANTQGTVVVWDTNGLSSEPIATFIHGASANITSLAWNPKKIDEIIFGDKEGQYGILKIESNASAAIFPCAQPVPDLAAFAAALDDDDDDFGEEFRDVLPSKNMPASRSTPINEVEAHPKPSSLQVQDNRAPTPLSNHNEMEDDPIDPFDDTEYDLGALKARYEPIMNGDSQAGPQPLNADELPNLDAPTSSSESEDEEGDGETKRKKKRVPFLVPDTPLPIVQKAFQPGAALRKSDDVYMMWNSIGIVSRHSSDTDDAIEVEFHDVTMHHTLHIANTKNYSLADLSAEALLLANKDDDNSTLFCMYFSAWDANKEWTVDLPEGETVDALAIGSAFAACATNKSFIRLFTLGGIQLCLFSIPGPVVCMSCQDDNLIIIYHQGYGIPESESLAMLHYRINSKKRPMIKQRHLGHIPICLTPKSTLYWSGFTDEGSPCTVDTEGIVRLFKPSMGNLWIPVADLKEKVTSKTDNYFVVGLSEIQQQIRCIFCKAAKYPTTVPWPSVIVKPFKLTLCDPDSGKGKLEEEHLRVKMLTDSLRVLLKDGFDVESQFNACSKKLSETLIKLFALAINGNRDSVALEVAQLLPNEKAVEGAVRYATSKRRIGLTQKLTELLEEKRIEEEEEEEEDDIRHRFEVTRFAPPPSDQGEVPRPKPISRKEVVSDNQETQEDSSSDVEVPDSNPFRSRRESGSDSGMSGQNGKENKRLINGVSGPNPFKKRDLGEKSKKSEKANRDSKKRSVSDSEEEDDGHSSHRKRDEEREELGFEPFFAMMKDEFAEQVGSDGEEDDVREYGRRQFRELASDTKEMWARREAKLLKKGKLDKTVSKKRKNAS